MQNDTILGECQTHVHTISRLSVEPAFNSRRVHSLRLFMRFSFYIFLICPRAGRSDNAKNKNAQTKRNVIIIIIIVRWRWRPKHLIVVMMTIVVILLFCIDWIMTECMIRNSGQRAAHSNDVTKESQDQTFPIRIQFTWHCFCSSPPFLLVRVCVCVWVCSKHQRCSFCTCTIIIIMTLLIIIIVCVQLCITFAVTKPIDSPR